VAYAIRCADAGGDCPAAFTTETRGELMGHMELHAAQAHPGMPLDSDTREQLEDLMRVVQVAAYPQRLVGPKGPLLD
jgi:predicted small metal-binding protein